MTTQRSALSVTLAPVDGIVISQDPLISRLLKGMYVSRPPLLRYQFTWHVSCTIAHLEDLPLPLSLTDLTLKTVMRVRALASAACCSELRELDIRFISFRPNEVVCDLPRLCKTQRVREATREIVLPIMADSQSLVCPALYLGGVLATLSHIPTTGLITTFLVHCQTPTLGGSYCLH